MCITAPGAPVVTGGPVVLSVNGVSHGALVELGSSVGLGTPIVVVVVEELG